MSPQDKAIPLIPMVTSASGHYESRTEAGALWQYSYRISAPGTRSESRSGQLIAPHGVDLLAARTNDRLSTPWGVMQLTSAPYDHGWLLERSGGRPIDPSAGNVIEVPAAALQRDGTWKGAVAPWTYTVRARAMGTKSELRAGELRYRDLSVTGERQGDFVETPWGRAHWMGPVSPEATTDYEQGFLLLGTFDRSLEQLQGQPITLRQAAAEVEMTSLYLEPPVKLFTEGRGAHGVRLRFRADGTGEMSGTLILDPNTCSLNAFGDREGCSKMAVRPFKVTIARQRLGDPLNQGRWFCKVRGDDLPGDLALILDPDFERCVLKHGDALVPMSTGASRP